VAPVGCVLALLASAFQPISIALAAVEAICCQEVAAPPALLLLRGLTASAIGEGTLVARHARQAAAMKATPVGGRLCKPSGRQQLVALRADLLLLRWWTYSIAQPAQHACTANTLNSIVSGYHEHGTRLHTRRMASAAQRAHDNIPNRMFTNAQLCCTQVAKQAAGQRATGNQITTHRLVGLVFFHCSRWQAKQCTQPPG
jgi:hypothetical protein